MMMLSSLFPILNVSDMSDSETGNLYIVYIKYVTILCMKFLSAFKVNDTAEYFSSCHSVKQHYSPISYQSTESGRSGECLPSLMLIGWCQLFLVRLPNLSYLSEN